VAKKGDTYGPWRLIERLGSGGNGEVWQCIDQGQHDQAIKLLKSHSNSERLARFRNEVGFLLNQGPRRGIIPIVDHRLDATSPWYVMPLATPIVKALGVDPLPKTVVEAVAEIAGTLAELADEKISHRDLKPDNLFKLNDVWSVGDFGLVKYPEAEALTQHGRKLGPVDYMAPEMRRSPDTANSELADVYSIAKTLWVLLTGSNLPLPGQHRADEEVCRLTSRLDCDKAPHLDLLIEKSTANDPGKRLQMREFARELRAMTAPATEGPTLSENTGVFEENIKAITEAHRRLDTEQAAFQNLIAAASHRLTDEVAKPHYWTLAKRIPSFNSRHPVQLSAPADVLRMESVYAGSGSWAGSLVAPGKAGVRLDVGYILRVHDQTGRCTIVAIVQVNRYNRGRGHVVDVLERRFESIVGGAHFDYVVGEISVAFADSVSHSLAEVSRALDAEQLNLRSD
jgi:serine/threonine protein kinase